MEIVADKNADTIFSGPKYQIWQHQKPYLLSLFR